MVLRRTVHILFILFEALFLNIVIPGHQRGIVTMAGCQSCAVVQQDQCCTMPGAATDAACSTEQHTSHSEPTATDKANCAICYFAVSLCVPPPPVIAQTSLYRVAEYRPFVAHVAISDALMLSYDSRAPPAAIS